jgi:hypothetical protein
MLRTAPRTSRVNISSTTRGITPGCSRVPCIVCVLPEDVTPYAKIVTVCVAAGQCGRTAAAATSTGRKNKNAAT